MRTAISDNQEISVNWVGEDGLIDAAKLRAIAYDAVHNDYLVLGEKVGNAFKDGNKLK